MRNQIQLDSDQKQGKSSKVVNEKWVVTEHKVQQG